MLENNAPAEYQQASRSLPPKDVQNQILQNLRRYAEQFMLNPAEFEVAGFMTLTTANLEIDPLSTEFALASVYHMVYLRQFGPFVRQFDTPEKRAAFVQNLPPEEMKPTGLLTLSRLGTVPSQVSPSYTPGAT